MLDSITLNKYDTNGMHKIYNKWNIIAHEAYEKNLNKIDVTDFDHIVFAGVGGSGTVGDIFASILSKHNIHVSIVKGYVLPSTIDDKTIVITTSVSGNSTETLEILNQTTKLPCKTFAFSSGGKMEQFCKTQDIDHFKISETHSPRASLPNFLYSMLNILEFVLSPKKNEIVESLGLLDRTHLKINSSNLTESNPSLTLASWMPLIPVIYYPKGLQASAIRFKNSLNENAKNHAIVEDVIEACHNNIVCWEKKTECKPILIQGEDDYHKTKERWTILKNYFKENNIDFMSIKSEKGSVLSKLMNLIYVLDFSSIYRGIMSQIDPTSVKSIDYIKSKL